MERRFASWGVDLFLVLVLLLAGIRFTSGLESVVDLSLNDEGYYLDWGVNLPVSGPPGAAYAPLYAVWYYLLSQIQPDRVELFFLNYKILTVLPPLLLYVLLRRYNTDPLLCLLCACALLFSGLNVLTSPKVCHFAVSTLFLCFICISSIRNTLWKLCLASLTALFVSYIRPEHLLTFILFSALFIGATLREIAKTNTIPWRAFGVYSVFFLSLFALFAIPFSADRSALAFEQHFAYEWAERTGAEVDPWINSREIMVNHFGSAEGILEACSNNPSLVLRHLATNFVATFQNAYQFIFPTFFPEDFLSRMAAALSILGLCVGFGNRLQGEMPVGRMRVFLIGVFLLPGICSVLVFYPRNHYLLIMFALSIVLLVLFFDRHTFRNLAPTTNTSLWRVPILVGLALLALTPTFRMEGAGVRVNLRTIRFIQSLNIEEPVRLLEADGGYDSYLGDGFESVLASEIETGFRRFMETYDIRMIVLSRALLDYPKTIKDPEWLDFLRNQQRYGFILMDVPGTYKKVLVKKDLLPGKLTAH